MVIGPMALQAAINVFGAITAKTGPVILNYIEEKLKTALDSKSTQGKGEIAALKKEVESLKQQLQNKGSMGESDLKQVQTQIEKAYQIQNRYGLELISDQSHKRWIIEQFEKLCEKEKIAGNFKIELWTKQGTATPRDVDIVPAAGTAAYHIGDKITLFFRSDIDCYLTLLNLGTSGSITVLFPNLLFQNNHIIGGKTYTIPGDGYPFEYILKGPGGIEKLRAIATANKVNLLDLDFSASNRMFNSARGSAAAKDIDMIEKGVDNLELGTWSVASCKFQAG